ncbi:hypothetical protein L838_4634 [Mycobacterium avium MAV_120709_2344]|nr:hypothetical protein L838_4634 [Mycobacterium avium MAV_120709_2344]
MTFGDRTPARWSRRQSASAIVAVLTLVAAVLGCAALRVEMAGDASQPGMVASAAELASGPARLNHEPVPARRLGIGSTVNDDLAFKSPGLKRDRATAFAFSTPRSSDSLVAPTAGVIGWQQRVDTPPRPPTPVPAGHNLRIQFCVARC